MTVTYVCVPLTEPQLRLLLGDVGGPGVEDPERFAVAYVLLKALGGSFARIEGPEIPTSG